MSVTQHRLVLLRHGQTEWSRDGKHTSRTNLDLTYTGRQQAELSAQTLAGLELHNPFVVSSPRLRAMTTADLAGLRVDEVSPLLAEWDYGDYEGMTSAEIKAEVPGWLLWTHGCPGGETVAQVSDRADQAVALALDHLDTRDVVFVGHGHFSRSVVTRWVQQPLAEGARYAFAAATVAVCGYEHGGRQLSALGLGSHCDPVAAP